MISETVPDGPSPPSPALPTEGREEDTQRDIVSSRFLRTCPRTTPCFEQRVLSAELQ